MHQRYSVSQGRKKLLNQIQCSSYPRHFPEASLAKVSSNILTAKTKWQVSIMMLLDLRTEFDTADNQLHNSPFLASEPLSSFSLHLPPSDLDTPRAFGHVPPTLLGLSPCSFTVSTFHCGCLTNNRGHYLFTMLESQSLGSVCKIGSALKTYVVSTNILNRSLSIFTSVLDGMQDPSMFLWLLHSVLF